MTRLIGKPWFWCMIPISVMASILGIAISKRMRKQAESRRQYQRHRQYEPH